MGSPIKTEILGVMPTFFERCEHYMALIRACDMREARVLQPKMRVCLLHADDVSKDLIEASRSAVERSGFQVSKTVCLLRNELSKSTTGSSISEYCQTLAALGDPDCKIVLALVVSGLIGPRDAPIFGAALRRSNSGPDVAVVSVGNLNPTTGGCPDEALMATRVQKEVIHELGHVLGLNHCSSYACVMRLSRNVSEIDMKPTTYCLMCLLRLAVMRLFQSLNARWTSWAPIASVSPAVTSHHSNT
jgi:predicted Zn-dependent protease